MRFTYFALLVLLTSTTFAQMPEGMQEAMECMQSIDQSAMEKLADEGKAMSEKLEGLCKAGKESEARSVAMGYAKTMFKDKNLVKMRECAEMMQKAMPQMDLPEMPTDEMTEKKAENICDEI